MELSLDGLLIDRQVACIDSKVFVGWSAPGLFSKSSAAVVNAGVAVACDSDGTNGSTSAGTATGGRETSDRRGCRGETGRDSLSTRGSQYGHNSHVSYGQGIP